MIVKKNICTECGLIQKTEILKECQLCGESELVDLFDFSDKSKAERNHNKIKLEMFNSGLHVFTFDNKNEIFKLISNKECEGVCVLACHDYWNEIGKMEIIITDKSVCTVEGEYLSCWVDFRGAINMTIFKKNIHNKDASLLEEQYVSEEIFNKVNTAILDYIFD